MLIENHQSILVGVDLQPKLLKAMKTDPTKNTHSLAKAAGILNIPTVFTEQYPQGLGHTADSLQEFVSEPASKPIAKTCFSAVKSPPFIKRIRELNKNHFILCGVEAHICILQTALGLKSQGNVFVVVDAVASINKHDYKFALRRMEQAGIGLVTTQMVLFEWLNDATHPQFKQVRNLIF